MTPKFYFNNEALPPCENLQVFAHEFTKTLLEYHKLTQNQDLGIHKGIITEKLPSEMSLGTFSLFDILHNIADPVHKRLAFAYFKDNYPIADHFTIDQEEEFLAKNYIFQTKHQDFEALYLAYIAKNQGFTFSVPVFPELQTDILEIVSQDGTNTKLLLLNLYGEPANTKFIKKHIEDLNYKQLGLFDKLKVVLGNAIFANPFEKEFQELPHDQQISVIDYFEEAKRRNLITPFYPDTKLVKDVTPNNSKNVKVYELRIYTPIALRVYFYETSNAIFLASICKKSNADQNADIVNACKTIKKLLITPS